MNTWLFMGFWIPYNNLDHFDVINSFSNWKAYIKTLYISRNKNMKQTTFFDEEKEMKTNSR